VKGWLEFSCLVILCDIVLIELSEKSVGLGVEAGYAYAKSKPIITLAKRGSDISATLRGISQKICSYNNQEELVHLLVNLIAVG
jgi:2'-deoxynucleoside 5'-phosphate N-hydrolase